MSNISNGDTSWTMDNSPNTTEPGLIKGIPDSMVDPDILLFRRVIHCADLYFVPVISIVGMCGNFICFLVFMATDLRKLSSSVYLAALSVCDTVFLFTTLCSWLDNVRVDIYHRHGWCQVLTYLGFVTSFLDVWYIVSFTIERYFVICYPLKRQTLCTTKRAKIVVSCLAIFGCTIFTFALWTSEVGTLYQRPFCSPKPEYFRLVLALTNVDTLITLIIPTILIVTCNIRITYAVTQFFRTHINVRNTRINIEVDQSDFKNQTTSYDPYSRAYQTSNVYNRLQMKVTKMLLLVSTAFLVCHIPSHSMRVYGFIMALLSTETYLPSHRTLLIQKFFQFFYLMNFGINVFLYSLSGKTFRRAMAQLFRIIRNSVTRFVWKKYTMVRSKSTSRKTREHIDLGHL